MNTNLSNDFNMESFETLSQGESSTTTYSSDNGIVNECPVCYDQIDNKKNNCTTTCGHSFCFKCMMNALKTNNSCPLCRTILQEEDEEDEDDEDDDEDDEDEDDDDDDDDDDEDEVDESIATVQAIAEKLTAKGITMEDILSLYLGRYNNINNIESELFEQNIEMLNDEVDNIVNECDDEAAREYDERCALSEEDKDATASAVAAINTCIDTVEIPVIQESSRKRKIADVDSEDPYGSDQEAQPKEAHQPQQEEEYIAVYDEHENKLDEEYDLAMNAFDFRPAACPQPHYDRPGKITKRVPKSELHAKVFRLTPIMLINTQEADRLEKKHKEQMAEIKLADDAEHDRWVKDLADCWKSFIIE